MSHTDWQGDDRLRAVIARWADWHGVEFSAEAGDDLAAALIAVPEAAVAGRVAAERAARHDAEARLSGLRWGIGAVVVAAVVVAMAVGLVEATTKASRAVARWEVSDGE